MKLLAVKAPDLEKSCIGTSGMTPNEELLLLPVVVQNTVLVLFMFVFSSYHWAIGDMISSPSCPRHKAVLKITKLASETAQKSATNRDRASPGF